MGRSVFQVKDKGMFHTYISLKHRGKENQERKRQQASKPKTHHRKLSLITSPGVDRYESGIGTFKEK